MSNTDRGVLGGGAIGAGTGAAIGSLTGHTGAGAAIGAIAGAVGGGLIGNAADERDRREQAARVAAANARPPLSLEEIANLAQQHVSDEIIITQIRTTGSVYNLTAEQIVWLRQVGVSERVIQEMQLTAQYPRPVVVVEPPCPPPPVHIGVGFGFGRCWH
jgi:surface antigen